MKKKEVKAYIATRLEQHARHNALRDRLATIGVTLTYDWTTHGSVQSEGADRIREVSIAEAKGVVDADFVIVLLPGGRGTHTELGIAIGANRNVVLVPSGPEDMEGPATCAFYHHPLVTVSESDEAVFEAIEMTMALSKHLGIV
jgi:hypothetical protein